MYSVFTAIVNKILSPPTLFPTMHLKSAAATRSIQAAYKGDFSIFMLHLKASPSISACVGDEKFVTFWVFFICLRCWTCFEKTSMKVKKEKKTDVGTSSARK